MYVQITVRSGFRIMIWQQHECTQTSQPWKWFYIMLKGIVWFVCATYFPESLVSLGLCVWVLCMLLSGEDRECLYTQNSDVVFDFLLSSDARSHADVTSRVWHRGWKDFYFTPLLEKTDAFTIAHRNSVLQPCERGGRVSPSLTLQNQRLTENHFPLSWPVLTPSNGRRHWGGKNIKKGTEQKKG